MGELGDDGRKVCRGNHGTLWVQNLNSGENLQGTLEGFLRRMGTIYLNLSRYVFLKAMTTSVASHNCLANEEMSNYSDL